MNLTGDQTPAPTGGVSGTSSADHFPSDLSPADFSVVVISPFAHGPGHPYFFARQLFFALRERGYSALAVSLLPWPQLDLETPADLRDIHSVFPLSNHQFEHLPSFLRKILFAPLLITLLCTIRAGLLRRQGSSTIYHFIDGSPLFLALLGLLTNSRVLLHIWHDLSPLFAEPPNTSPFRQIWFRFRRKIYLKALARRNLILISDSLPIATHLSASNIPTHFIRYAISGQTPPMSSASARDLLGVDQKVFTCLLFGTHRWDKDYETVFRSLEQLAPKVHLLIAGKTISGPPPSEIAARHPQVSTTIRDAFIPEHEAATWFAACDVVILPYRGERVAGSGLVYEALRYERPVITTAGGFLGDFVSEFRTGFTYPDGDSNELTKSLVGLLDMDSPTREKLTDHLRTVKKEHEWPSRIGDYVRLYHLRK